MPDSTNNTNPWRFCVAPMMEWTDRHCRYFLRLISKRARLYTEMVTTPAILNGDRERLIGFHEAEHPVALQLGGSDPDALARCAEIGQERGYDEINLNCGCPSDRVREGAFGVCLMLDPGRVARCVSAMRSATSVPVTVKNRIGVDDSEDYAFLKNFVETVAAAGCETFIVHARKAWLSGLSPKENREVPPLQYDKVLRLKQEFPTLTIVMNGGIQSLEQARTHLGGVDGVMLGREAYQNPWILEGVDREFFGDDEASPSRSDTLLGLAPYIEDQQKRGVPFHSIARHILGLYRNRPGGRAFRRILSEAGRMPNAGTGTLHAALKTVESGDSRQAA